MMLYIVRHAYAGQRGDPQYPDDAQRPLTKKGRKRFKRLVRSLAGRGFAPQVIATSPLVRCRQTAEVMAKEVCGCPEMVELQQLAPDSDLQGLIAWTRGRQETSVAWVGHAPDVESLAAGLIGARADGLQFAKGAIAAVRFDDQVAQGQGQLQWLATARILGC